MSKHPTIAEHLEASGVSRRSFLQLCSVLMATGPILMWSTRREKKRLAIGRTYEPPTFLERRNWGSAS